MKILEEERVDQLLGIINLYPLVEIAHFCDDYSVLNEKIDHLCRTNDYNYRINCTDSEQFEECRSSFENSDNTTVKEFDLDRPKYMIQAKFYDYLFVTSDIEPDKRASFLKKSYVIIKNAGLIFIFVPKEDNKQKEIWTDLLQENYFVATSVLDIFSQYDVIISKKMHGWGG